MRATSGLENSWGKFALGEHFTYLGSRKDDPFFRPMGAGLVGGHLFAGMAEKGVVEEQGVMPISSGLNSSKMKWASKVP